VVIVICAVLAIVVIVVIDALRSRIKIGLRTKATARTTQRPSHELSTGEARGGWRPLEGIQGDERGGDLEQNPFERILGRDRR
jgi:hypothetical protein